MNKRLLVCVVLAWGIGHASAFAQPTTPAAPAGFEVASVKPSTPNGSSPLGSRPMVVPQGGRRFTATNMPLRLLVRMVYGLQDFQIVGGPSWQTSSRFDITAKADDGTVAATPELLPLVQTLLADRFKLKAHTETRKMPIYALVVSRSDGQRGPSLKPSSSDCKDPAAENQRRV